MGITSKHTSLLFAALLAGCSTKKTQEPINYLNQEPPGLTATLFAEGTISSTYSEHSAPAFSPDGKTVVWTVMDPAFRAMMMEMTYDGHSWSPVHRASFADSTADDIYPSFAVDGKKLYFSSRRKAPAGYPAGQDNRIWTVEREENAWGNPVPLDTTVFQGGTYANSESSAGTLYFSSALGGATGWSIYQATKKHNTHQKATLLPFNINSMGYEEGPFIAPDESYLIFESDRLEGVDGSIDLYISFKNKNGQWGIPINMGARINTAYTERFARLSPDGKYLFFGSTRNQTLAKVQVDIYWISAAVIEELRKKAVANPAIDLQVGNEILAHLSENNFAKAAPLLDRWVAKNQNSLDALLIYNAVLRKKGDCVQAEQLLAKYQSRWKGNTGFVMEAALVKYGLNKNDEAEKLLQPLLVKSEHQHQRYLYLSDALLEMKLFSSSDDYFKEAMKLESWTYGYYRRARAFAQIGEKNKAFDNLNAAIALGYKVKQDYEADPELSALRADERWALLRKKLQ